MPKPSRRLSAVSLAIGIRDVVPQAMQISEAQVKHLRSLLLSKLEDLGGAGICNR